MVMSAKINEDFNFCRDKMSGNNKYTFTEEKAKLQEYIDNYR
jgi:hypothetical protein